MTTTMTTIAQDEAVSIELLPLDILAYIFSFFSSFKDLNQASGVCWKWYHAVEQSLARKERLSFAGWKMDDESTARLVIAAYNLKELDISRSCWASQITDQALYKISHAKCVRNLTSISLWGMAGITDKGVVELVSRAHSLQYLNIGGTFITDESLYAIANNCPDVKVIVLWSCRHVTESGLNCLVNKCLKLQSINAWGMRIPIDFLNSLLIIHPSLQIKPISQYPSVGSVWPVA